MGNDDGFTSPKQLEDVVKRSKGETRRIIVPGVGHFELEAPHYDEYLGEKIVEFCDSLQHWVMQAEGPSQTPLTSSLIL